MPQVVNGCGTWYYGKKNVQQYPGLCRACNRVTTLTSYDTRLFVVFLFIPIFPLGRKRIIEECAACRRHHAMAYSDWERAQRRAHEAFEAYHRSPTDPKLAEEAIGACLGYRMAPAFLELVPVIEQHLASDPKTMCLLAAACDLFGHLQDTERLLLNALQVQDDYETRELLADCLLRQDRPDEATPYLQHIVDEGIPDRVNLLYQLAQGYQMKGEHEKALAVFQQCEAINPGIVEDEVFARLRDTSARHLGTHVAVKPAAVANRIKRGAAFRRFMKVAPVVLVLAAVAYGALAWIQGLRREVFLVNGLERAYSVQLNGNTHELQPQSVTKVRQAEGQIEVAIVDAPPGVTPETITIQTAFLTRPFANRTFVINPDQAAILRRTRFYYSPSTSGAASLPEHSFTGGQTLHEFQGVDHPFEEPPSSISTDSHSRRVSRDGVYLMSSNAQVAMPAMIFGLLDNLGNDVASRLAQQHLLMEPQRTEYLPVLSETTGPEELVAFLRTGVSQHPLELQWHRAYQSAMEESGKQQEVEREYDAMLAKDPQNKNLMYLAARVSLSIDKAFNLFRQSTEGDSPCPYGFYALCGYYLGLGQFREAAENGEKAFKLLPNELEVQWYYRQALLADGQYEKLLARLKTEETAPAPWCLTAIEEEAYVQSVLGEQAKVKEAIGHLDARLKELGSDSTAERVKGLEAQLAYAAGNPSQFVKTLLESSEPDNHLAAHLANGDPAAAEQQLPHTTPTARIHVLFYLVAMTRNQPDMATRHLQAAVDLLAKGKSEDQIFARALKGDAGLPLDDALRQHESPHDKAILLAAVGLRNPAGREKCFALAQKLNYDKRFPHLLLKQVLASQPAN